MANAHKTVVTVKLDEESLSVAIEKALKQWENKLIDAMEAEGDRKTIGDEDFWEPTGGVSPLIERGDTATPLLTPHGAATAGVNDTTLTPGQQALLDSINRLEPHPEFDGGGVREAQGDRPRFELLVPEGVPYEEQILTRFAVHMAKGAEKYASRNWEQFSDKEALERAKSSAFRHLMQWLAGVDDGEDHAAATLFNIMCAEHVQAKLDQAKLPPAPYPTTKRPF